MKLFGRGHETAAQRKEKGAAQARAAMTQAYPGGEPFADFLTDDGIRARLTTAGGPAAMEAVLDTLRRRWVGLGMALAGGADPAETAARMAEVAEVADILRRQAEMAGK